MNVDLANKF